MTINIARDCERCSGTGEILTGSISGPTQSTCDICGGSGKLNKLTSTDLDTKFDAIDTAFDDLDTKLDAIEVKIDDIKTVVDAL